MPLTPEQRARIARENGAKSKGPVTPEGKERSSRNALKSGEYATKFAAFFPPHFAVVANEEREGFTDLLNSYLDIYQPANHLTEDIVRDLAAARWQIERLHALLTLHWNRALFDAAQKPGSLPAEMAGLDHATRAGSDLLTGPALCARINREIARLQKQTLFLERRLQYVHENFRRVVARKPTEPRPVQPVENTEPAPEAVEKNEPAVYLNEDEPAVIAAYRRDFPNHKIVILPPDNVAKGIDEPDNIPVVPRIAA